MKIRLKFHKVIRFNALREYDFWVWYLYLDESGDLGFDFVNKKPSRHFTVCILATSHRESFTSIQSAVRKTIKRKLRRAHGTSPLELKGSRTAVSIKKHFWEQIRDDTFGIYAVTLNKRRVYDQFAAEKDRVYNFIARQVIDHIPFELATDRVQIVADRCKSSPEIAEFNSYIESQLKARLDPKVALHIDHLESHIDPMLQAVDLFAWGIFRRYEHLDEEWYSIFKSKVRFDDLYLR